MACAPRPAKRLQELFFEWRAGNPGETLRQAVEQMHHLEHTIEGNGVLILERGIGLIEMHVFASEAEIMMEKNAIAKLEKAVTKAQTDILGLEVEIMVMEKELLKIARKPAKRLRLVCRQLEGAPVNNPKVTQLCYSQVRFSAVFCCLILFCARKTMNLTGICARDAWLLRAGLVRLSTYCFATFLRLFCD